ncbi:MAG: hypothetical protein ACSLFE_11455 [Gemmatimonadaceae bacterium]
MPNTRSLILMVVAVALAAGCGDRKPEPPPPAAPITPAAVPSPPVAELTGWPAGLGRALVLRLTSPEESYRLIVPELGDRRFADSSISVKVGDSLPVALLGRRGKAGEALLSVVDAEAGAGACVTWPSVQLAGARFEQRAGAAGWRVAVERDSVTPVVVDSLLGMRSDDSASFSRAIYSLLPNTPALTDSTLRGIPFVIRRGYAFSAAGVSIMAAELVRTSSSEADPREQRVFVVGERTSGEQAHGLAFSSDETGRTDNTPVTELLATVVSTQSRRPILVIGVEASDGMRVQLIQRVARRQWRGTWTSVVKFC